MTRLDLALPLAADQALLHIATGTSRFVRSVRGRSQLQMARDWLALGGDGVVPTRNKANRDRLTLLRQAMSDQLGGIDGYELAGWAWFWLAKSSCPSAIHPACDENWGKFLAERSSSTQRATVTGPIDAKNPGVPRQRYELENLVRGKFDLARAMLLGNRGQLTPPQVRRQARVEWRSTGLEPEIRLALQKLAKSRPDVLTDGSLGKPYRCEVLDRFDLFVALCKVHAPLEDSRYSGATLLKCLQTLVATRRGRRPSSHPFEAPLAKALLGYVAAAKSDQDWLNRVYFPRR
ncbi:MAG: hypothetical protein J0L58_13715 [Burkholderiales bacterium]|nr:hypothetical protein [Burkholderiales bacterium]